VGVEVRKGKGDKEGEEEEIKGNKREKEGGGE
jgi:hypothetical protein